MVKHTFKVIIEAVAYYNNEAYLISPHLNCLPPFELI